MKKIFMIILGTLIVGGLIYAQNDFVKEVMTVLRGEVSFTVNPAQRALIATFPSNLSKTAISNSVVAAGGTVNFLEIIPNDISSNTAINVYFRNK